MKIALKVLLTALTVMAGIWLVMFAIAQSMGFMATIHYPQAETPLVIATVTTCVIAAFALLLSAVLATYALCDYVIGKIWAWK